MLARYVSDMLLRYSVIPEECHMRRNFEIEKQLREIGEFVRRLGEAARLQLVQDSDIDSCITAYRERHFHDPEPSDLPLQELLNSHVPLFRDIPVPSSLAPVFDVIREITNAFPVLRQYTVPFVSITPVHPTTSNHMVSRDKLARSQAFSVPASFFSYVHILTAANETNLIGYWITPGLINVASIHKGTRAIILTDSIEGLTTNHVRFKKNGIDDIAWISWYSPNGELPDIPWEILPDLPIFYLLLKWGNRSPEEQIRDIRTVAHKWNQLGRKPLRIVDCRTEFHNGIHRYPSEFGTTFYIGKLPNHTSSSCFRGNWISTGNVFLNKSEFIWENLIYTGMVSIFNCSSVRAKDCVGVLLERLLSYQKCLRGFSQRPVTYFSRRVVRTAEDMNLVAYQMCAHGFGRSIAILELGLLDSDFDWKKMYTTIADLRDRNHAIVLVMMDWQRTSSFFHSDISIVVTDLSDMNYCFEYRGEKTGHGTFTCKFDPSKNKIVKKQTKRGCKRKRFSSKELDDIKKRLSEFLAGKDSCTQAEIAKEFHLSLSMTKKLLGELGLTQKRTAASPYYGGPQYPIVRLNR